MGIVRLFAALSLLACACAHGDAGAPGDINTAILARYEAIVGSQDDHVRARIEAAAPCSHVPNGPGNAAQGVHPPVPVPVQNQVCLPRIVAIDDDRHYPDAFRWTGAPPLSLEDAVDSMFRALPKVDAAIPDRDVCTFTSLDDMDSGLSACRQSACLRVPPTSRERGCGYLVQLSNWMEEAWLGGLCLTRVEQRSGPLIEWFRLRGVSQCHQMSAALSIALAQALVGKRQDVDGLLRPFVVENQRRD